MIIFLYGDDTFRSRQKLNEIKNKFLKEVDPSGNSLVRLEGGNLDLAKFNEMAGISSLFARRRMVIIEKLLSLKSKETTDQFAVYLKKNFSQAAAKSAGSDQKNIILFWEEAVDEKASKTELFKFLSRQKFAYSFKRLSATDTTAWVKKEFSRRGAKISASAASYLAGLSANDLWQIDNEINKLINYKEAQKEKSGKDLDYVISEADISAVTKGGFNENIFALADAIGRRDKATAAVLLESELAAGAAEIGLLAMIIRQFRIMLLIRQCLDKSYTSRKMASALKLHPFVVQKSLTQVRNFPLAALKRILNSLFEMDKAVKTGRQDAKTALSALLAKI